MINRRNFIKSSACLISAAPFNRNIFSKKFYRNDVTCLIEPSRNTPIVNESDVIVCGGGPAGIAAAIASARQGAKTTLIEMYGCLGGIWTTGLLSFIIDYENKSGLMKELVQRLEKTDAQYTAKAYDTELMKWILDTNINSCFGAYSV